MENGKGRCARSTVDMHRVRVRNRASVGATVARRAYSPALSVHAYRRDKAIRRRDRTRQPVTTPQLVTPLESVKQADLLMELEGGHRNSVIKRRNPIEFGLFHSS
ncbi:hypothetical protein EVAR_87702_1 [Eumeta japonica]|uniref:Uncharacterized protein n=1 Tax=Eumeta variegata TaxID=151549 RepID=A0A4C2A9U1_EUMVA|nr:hypothetical protein EVAR_87702_1 [Eumeta japonica]